MAKVNEEVEDTRPGCLGVLYLPVASLDNTKAEHG